MDNKKKYLITKIELDELKKIELDILSYVDSFCREKHILYSLTGGTLLGAVRHKGFIPWDDDIDLMFNRKNYDAFLNLFPTYSKDSNYELLTYKNTKNYNYLFAKIVDKRTVVIENHTKKIDNYGVFIDLFPIDNIDNNYDKAIKKLKKIEFNKYLTVASNWKHFFINKNHNLPRQIIRFLFFIMSRFVNSKKIIKKIEEKFKYNNNMIYSACICGSYSIEKEITKTDIYNNYTELLFENKKFMAIKDYDTYLKSIYGYYMLLPPVEKRVTRHSFVAFHKYNSYNKTQSESK